MTVRPCAQPSWRGIRIDHRCDQRYHGNPQQQQRHSGRTGRKHGKEPFRPVRLEMPHLAPHPRTEYDCPPVGRRRCATCDTGAGHLVPTGRRSRAGYDAGFEQMYFDRTLRVRIGRTARCARTRSRAYYRAVSSFALYDRGGRARRYSRDRAGARRVSFWPRFGPRSPCLGTRARSC
jgi:hypothetical protein